MPNLFALEYVCRRVGGATPKIPQGSTTEWKSHLSATKAYLKRFSITEKDPVQVTKEALALSQERIRALPKKKDIYQTSQNHYGKLVPFCIKQAIEWFVLEIGRIRNVSGCTANDAVLILSRLSNRRNHRTDQYDPLFSTTESWQENSHFSIMNHVLQSIHLRLHMRRQQLGMQYLGIHDVDRVIQNLFGVFLFVKPQEWAHIRQLRQQYFDQLEATYRLKVHRNQSQCTVHLWQDQKRVAEAMLTCTPTEWYMQSFTGEHVLVLLTMFFNQVVPLHIVVIHPASDKLLEAVGMVHEDGVMVFSPIQHVLLEV